MKIEMLQSFFIYFFFNCFFFSTTFYIEHQRVSVNDIGNHVGDANPRFGVVRDRLFHAMLVCFYFFNF